MDYRSDASPPAAVDLRAGDAASGRIARPRAPDRHLPALLRWHRRLGLVALTGVVLWCASGVLHPIMTRLQPEPARFRAALRLPALGAGPRPADVLRANGIGTVADLRVVVADGEPAYQVTVPDEPERRYFALKDGARLADGDRRYAERLARGYLSDAHASVADARLVTEFGYEYPYINRLLPVWRVEFDRPDHMRAFVDTRTGRLGALSHDAHAISSATFSILHRWLWLDRLSPAARLVVLSVLIASVLSVTAIGAWLYVIRWNDAAAQWNLRRVHRAAGITVSVVVLMLPLTGVYHLLHMGIRGDPADRHAIPLPRVAARDLVLAPGDALARARIGDVESLSLSKIGDEVYYRVQPATSGARPFQSHAGHTDHAPSGKVTPGRVAAGSDAIYVSAANGTIDEAGELKRALAVAQSAVGRVPTGEVRTVTQFDDEYGFVFKRLPVIRVDFGGGVAAFVDPSDGAIAAVVDRADWTEGWVFAYVHKFEWLVPFVGPDARDAIAASLAVLLATATVLGAVLYARRSRS